MPANLPDLTDTPPGGPDVVVDAAMFNAERHALNYATAGRFNILEQSATAGGGVDDDWPALSSTDAANAGNGVNYLPPTRYRYRIGTSGTVANALQLPPHAILKPDSGKTLTLNGPLDAGPYQIFDLSAGGSVAAGTGFSGPVLSEWWGYDHTGALNVDAAINAAIAFASAHGGVVQLLQYPYRVGNPLAITASNVSLLGVPGATQIVNANLAADALQVTGTSGSPLTNTRVSGVLVTSVAGTRTAGNALTVQHTGSACYLDHLELDNHVNGLALLDDSSAVEASHMRLYGNSVNHIVANGAAGHPSGGLTLRDIRVGQTAGYAGSVGLLLNNVAGLTIDNVDITSASGSPFNSGGYAIQMLPSAGQSVDWGFWHAVLADGATNTGLLIQPAGGVVRSQHFVDCWAATNGGHGMLISDGSAGSVVDDLSFTDFRALHNNLHGVDIVHSAGTMRNVRFVNPILSGNSVSSSGTYNGIQVEAGVSGVDILGGKAGYSDQGYPTVANYQNFGVAILTSCTNVRATDVDVTGNIQASGIYNGSPSGSGVVLRDCPGYNPVGLSSPTVGASPWTFTFGSSPGTLYLYGGTVSSVTKGGVTIATSSPAQISGAPHDSVVVTYSVAPTAALDTH